jgi:hypothetical protein
MNACLSGFSGQGSWDFKPCEFSEVKEDKLFIRNNDHLLFHLTENQKQKGQCLGGSYSLDKTLRT